MKCLWWYSINIKKSIVVTIHYLLSVHRVLGVKYHCSEGEWFKFTQTVFCANHIPYNSFVVYLE